MWDLSAAWALLQTSATATVKACVVEFRSPTIECLHTASPAIVSSVEVVRLRSVILQTKGDPLLIIVANPVHEVGYHLGAGMDGPEVMDVCLELFREPFHVFLHNPAASTGVGRVHVK